LEAYVQRAVSADFIGQIGSTLWSGELGLDPTASDDLLQPNKLCEDVVVQVEMELAQCNGRLLPEQMTAGDDGLSVPEPHTNSREGQVEHRAAVRIQAKYRSKLEFRKVALITMESDEDDDEDEGETENEQEPCATRTNLAEGQQQLCIVEVGQKEPRERPISTWSQIIMAEAKEQHEQGEPASHAGESLELDADLLQLLSVDTPSPGACKQATPLPPD
jgi:hypothetical protein